MFLVAVRAWRASGSFPLISQITNGALIAVSVVLLSMQICGYVESATPTADRHAK